MRWPTQGGAGLGVAGAWNFALRVGLVPKRTTDADLAPIPLEVPVFACLDRAVLGDGERRAIRDRVERGGAVVATGDPAAWSEILPELFRGSTAQFTNPYAAVGYEIDGRVELIAPPRWPYFAFDATGEAGVNGRVVSIAGERQTPSRALVTPQAQAPAIVRWRGVVFLNASPFHAFQSWLQGQEDLQPWLQWRHRLFWLDEWTSAVRALLIDAGVPLPRESSSALAGLESTSVVVRHDLDYSRDTTYLDFETAQGIPAVHGILRDANAGFWIDRLRRHPDHETALHYNTARYSRAVNWIGERLGLPSRAYVPARSDVSRRGLHRQVRWARRRGIGIATLHRHLSFMLYPEWIDAFDYVLDCERDVLGASSLFRGQVLRWGVDRSDGGRGTYGVFPDAQFPYWFPFKIAHAGDNGRLLRGWETTSVMEIEPELFEQMLNHRVRGLPHRLFTIGFHPAHAARPTFERGGSAASFRRIVEIIRSANLSIVTLKTALQRLNAAVAEDRAVHSVQ